MPSALQVAYILHNDGRPDRASYLYDKMLDVIRPLQRNAKLGYGAEDVAAHAVRGDKQKSYGCDSGWCAGWWEFLLP